MKGSLKSVDYKFYKFLIKYISMRQHIYIMLNYCRQTLGQTGSGHYSPIGGYSESDNKGIS